MPIKTVRSDAGQSASFVRPSLVKAIRSRWSRSFALVVLACGLVGCEAGVDTVETIPGSDSQATSADAMVLSEMPEGDVVSPTDVMELEGQPSTAVLAGRITAGEMDPFQPDELTFMLSQLPDEGHGADDPDHADNCPFCKRKLENAPKAIVQFRGTDGEVLKGDARKRLGLQKGDVVYVTGTSTYNADVNTVMVDATGIYRAAR